MNYTELFREKRLEYYQDTGISCNAVLMSDYFAKELMKENDMHLYSGSKFLGVEVIIHQRLIMEYNFLERWNEYG